MNLEGFLLVVREKVKTENDATFLDVYDVFASQNGHFSHLAENLKGNLSFKAKKVTFCEIRRDFAISTLCAPEIHFLRTFKENCIFSVSGPKNQVFRLGASKKAPRTLCLSLLLRRGRRSLILGPKDRFWAPKLENE